ncbi:hypothetical protein [Tepidiforma bonchosmolovskayae]|uniref:M23 family metallopeptidase n=1 Tax=Tepidiforma bonchosmolovskayae TaxID=2601677 RepID=A0ABX6C1D0_9CHLR|nr:hypothetical protein [Tepidiforma bonchosmolovskayae]QFG02835.1 hypothetical protein Tbon_05875 [Tepidiforma bonchosmolovskayae]
MVPVWKRLARRAGWFVQSGCARFSIAIAAAVLGALTASTVAAHYGYVRAPLAASATVTSEWSHGSSYGERALDLSASGVSVYSNLQNPSSSDYLYYEVYNYQGTSSCPGSKFHLYRHTGNTYYYYGTVNYVHLGDHSSLWGRSVDIAPGQSETWLYVGYTVASCGSPAHLHFGHLANDGIIEYINPPQGSTVSPSQLILYY